jgi:glutathione S-transferase
MITLHHLHQSRSFRIVWLMEELGLPYDLVCHDRKPDFTAPDTLAAVHVLSKAPVIVDGETVLFESGAIMEYVIHRYGQGHLSVPSHHMHSAHYLQWLHAAEGTCLPSLMPIIRHHIAQAEAPTETQTAFSETVLRLTDDALTSRDYFGGTAFTAADIMMEMYLALAARFTEPAFARRSCLHPFLDRVHARDAYRRAKDITEPPSATS